MRVAFRVDASERIGSGHLMRCLTLADALAARGARALFLCRAGAPQPHDLVRARGHALQLVLPGPEGGPEPDAPPHAAWLAGSQAGDVAACLPELTPWRPDWVVVDHYALDHRWESAVRATGARLLVIDDLADRQHDCDALIDQNFYHDATLRYRDRLPAGCRCFLGPAHALLRPEFEAARRTAVERAGPVRRVLAFFGGFDALGLADLTLDVLQDLARTGANLQVDLVLGAAHPRHGLLAARARGVPGLAVHGQVSNMATLMAAADLAVGAGGATTLERCYLGLPSVVVDVADNQRAMLVDLAAAGATVHLGSGHSLSRTGLGQALGALMADEAARRRMSSLGMRLVDSGVTGVIEHMEAITHAQAR